MENNYVENEYSQESGGFQFKNFWNLIKKSGFRILIFAVIAAIVMCIFSAIFIAKTRTSVDTASTVIIFEYKGIEKGLDPNGQPLDASKIKSASVVNSAVTELIAKGVKIDESKQGEIINNLEVTALIPADVLAKIKALEILAKTDPTALSELSSIKYYPFQYRISFNNFRELGITNDAATKLLDEIIKQYSAFFKREYSKELIPGTSLIVIKDITDPNILTSYGYDYLEFYDMYFNQINELTKYLKAKSVNNPLYVSLKQGKSFSDLTKSLELIQKIDLFKYETFILQNGITLDREFLSYSLKSHSNEYDRAITESEANGITLQKLIDDYKGNQILVPDGNGGWIPVDGDARKKYDELIDQLYENEKSTNSLKTEKEVFDIRLLAYQDAAPTTNTKENQLAALKMLGNLSTTLNAHVNNVKAFVTEYLDAELFNAAIATTQPSLVTNISTNELKTALIISAIVCVLAVIAAVIVTSVIEKKKSKNLEEKDNSKTNNNSSPAN